jgi:hypothetical protein
MSFLAPLFLLGTLAAAVPIVLHLLKREPDARIRFSAVKLLRSAPVEHAHKRRLRELLLLALRVSALVLLAFAFARPFFAAGASAGSSAVTVVMLDTSASMSAPGQFEKARLLAQQAIERAGGDRIAVITFSDNAEVVARPSGDRALAAAAVDAARAGAGSTRCKPAFAAAVDLLEGRPGTLVVVTDLQASGWDAGDRAAVPESVRVEIADVGPPPQNLAVTAIRVAGDRIVATIRNAGPALDEARVMLDAGDNDVAAAAIRTAETRAPLAAHASTDVTFALPTRRWASVTVDDTRGVAADNTRYVVLDRASRPSVLVVTTSGDLGREAFYVEQALLAAASDGRAYDVVGVAGGDLHTWDRARIDRHPAVVLLSTRGLEHQARALLAAYAQKGGGILIAASADVDPEVLTQALGGLKIEIVPPAAEGSAGALRTLVPSDVRHPALRAFAGRASLALVKFRQWSAVRSGTGACQTLARFTSGEAALMDCEVGNGRALLFASDLGNRWNDFPRHATFLPFLHEAIRYLSPAGRSSDYAVGEVPPGIRPSPGVARAGPEGEHGRLVSVNVDPHESDPRRLTPEEFQAALAKVADVADDGGRLPAQEDEDRQAIWRYLLVLMIGMLIVESAVAARIA